MASEEIDWPDAIAGAFFTLATAAAVGWISFNAFGVQLQTVLATVGPIDITNGTILALAALGVAMFTNEMMPSDMNREFDGWYWALAVGTPILVVLIGGWDPVTTEIVASDYLGAAALAIQALGFGLISYRK